MIKKTITYTDYNGFERKEDFYFNLNEAEILEMEMTTKGGLGGFLEKIVQTQDQPSIFKAFKELILKAYGVKGADGRRFEKSEELSKDFEQTEAYSKLVMELATKADKAAEFVNGIVPAEMAKQLENKPALKPVE